MDEDAQAEGLRLVSDMRDQHTPNKGIIFGSVFCVLSLVLAGGLIGLFLPHNGASVDAKWPTVEWGDCSVFMNDSRLGFPSTAAHSYTGGCAQLSLCNPGQGMLGYRTVWSECISPGPTLLLRSGHKFGLVFCVDEAVGESSNLHFHGLHIPGTGNADDVTRVAGMGECIWYSLELLAHHMGGTHLYHAHVHGTTAAQVSAGAFGLIIVEDQPREMVFMDSEPQSAKFDGPWALLTKPEWQKQLVVMSRNDIWSTATGANGTMTFENDVWYRLRILALDPRGRGSVIRFPTECTVFALAHDGVFLFSVPSAAARSQFFLTGASRLDVAIQCGSRASGTWVFVDDTPVAPLLVVSHRSPSEPTSSPWTPNQGRWKSWRPAYLADLTGDNCDDCQRFNVTLTSTTVNGLAFAPACPLKTPSGSNFGFDRLNEWTLLGTKAHPFHLHLYHQQIIRGCGEDSFEDGEYYDTISAAESTSMCVVRFRTLTHAARVMLHCHILQHEDAGAMGWIHVTPDANVTYGVSPCCQIGVHCTTPCVSLPPDDCGGGNNTT